MQVWWLMSLIAVAGCAWWVYKRGGGGSGSQTAVDEARKIDGHSKPSKSTPPASVGSTDVSGNTPRGNMPATSPAPSASSRLEDHLDPRHVRHVNISESFLSAASAFQTEE